MDPASSSKDDSLAPAEMGDRDERRDRSAQGVFVGRDTEMSQGLAALEDALGGRGRLLLLAGEPGIGKSRMADELAARAEQRGVQVVWGRCWEAGGAPAYWPWVQSLRSLVRNLDAAQLRAQMGAGAVDIAHLLPDIRGLLGDLPDTPTLDPDAARFRLFDSATTFLKNSAAVRPIMLVLDDLQVADTPSLLLLRFVAGALGDSRMLVLGAYRDTELGYDHPLASTLTELTREQAVRRLTIRGLAEADVARFINATAGISLPESLARTVHDETEGNALFVEEVIRLLIDEGRLDEGAVEPGPRLGMPRSVREVIRQRLRPLAEECLHILTLASVMGREFNLDALSRLAEHSFDDILESLEQPLAARVITDVPGTRGQLRFAHVAIRECLYEDIGRTRRMQLHRRAAQVLEALYEDDPEPHLAELAYHFFEGAPGGDLEKAIEYARRAGAKAVALLAYEEAVRLYRMALQGLGSGPAKDLTERCDVLLALGDAQARAGDEAAWKATFLEAADLSRSLGLRDHLARAALGYGGRLLWVRAGGDPHLIHLLEDGLAAVGEGDSVLRARILARLAGALRDDPSPEPRESLARQAVDVARRLGDPATLAYTLEGLWAALWKPDNPHDRLGIANEIVAVGERAADPERAAHQYRLLVFLELGDMRSAYSELEVIDRIAEELRQPAQSWLRDDLRVELALLEGRLEDAEHLTSAAFRVRGRSNRSDAVVHHAIHLFQLRTEQARLAEVEEIVRTSARDFPWYPMLRCMLAWLHGELGRETEARIEFAELAAGGFACLPFDNHWLFSMSLLSQVAYVLADDGRAKTLYEMLLPYAERTSLAAGDGSTGSLSRPLGLLAAVSSRFDDAERHFEEALERNGRMGARPAVAHTQYDLAAMLVNRDGFPDRERAIELLGAALRTCDQLAMPALRAQVTALLEHLGAAASATQTGVATAAAAAAATPRTGAPPSSVRTDHRSVEDGAFRREGEYWTIGYEGRVLRLRDSKGLRVLARLVAEPGRPYASLDLERLGAEGDGTTARAVASGDAGELLDDEARRAYRARLAELREAIEEADAWGKADEAGTLREEMDFITHELGRALGLGGRPRRAGSIAERARLNVTRAVKSAMRRIAAADAELATHLEATVHTGTVCVYSPDPRAAVRWRVFPGEVHPS